MITTTPRILIIRLGALGDMILSTGCIKSIRAHHPDAHITLMTTPPYAKLMQACPYVDAIEIDTRPSFAKPYKIKAWRQTLRILRQHYSHVYDLQTSKRSGWYLRFLPSPKPMRSGIIEGCSHRHNTPERSTSHTLDRQCQQLQIAGIMDVSPPDISWMQADVSRFQLPQRYALIAAGGSAHRPEKRWTVEGFTRLAKALSADGVLPVFLGTAAEADVLDAITKNLVGIPHKNLCNETSFYDIAQLGRDCVVAVGNDTGPMHLIAATGSKSLVLFSYASDPTLCAPRGEHIKILRRPTLEQLAFKDVRHLLTEWGVLGQQSH